MSVKELVTNKDYLLLVYELLSTVWFTNGAFLFNSIYLSQLDTAIKELI